jgi:hypothetical protein
LAATLLVAASASAVLHARLAREYSLLVLLAALALAAAARHRRRGSAATGAALALLAALGLHTHAAFGGLILALAALAPLDPSPRTAARRILPPLLAAALLYAPWPAALALREGNPVWHLYRSTGSYLESRLDARRRARLFRRARPPRRARGAALAGLLVAGLVPAPRGRPRSPPRARALVPCLAPRSSSPPSGGRPRAARYLPPSCAPRRTALAAALRARRAASARPLAGLALSPAPRSPPRDRDEERALPLERPPWPVRRPGDLVVVEPPSSPTTTSPAPRRSVRSSGSATRSAPSPTARLHPVDSAAALLLAAGAPRVVYWFYPYFDSAALGSPFADPRPPLSVVRRSRARRRGHGHPLTSATIGKLAFSPFPL